MTKVCSQQNSQQPLLSCCKTTVNGINTNAFENHHIFQFQTDCGWQSSVPTCFCTLHRRKPSPGTEPGKRTRLMFLEGSSDTHAIQLQHSHRRCEISHCMLCDTSQISGILRNPVHCKLGILKVALSRCQEDRFLLVLLLGSLIRFYCISDFTKKYHWNNGLCRSKELFTF